MFNDTSLMEATGAQFNIKQWNKCRHALEQKLIDSNKKVKKNELYLAINHELASGKGFPYYINMPFDTDIPSLQKITSEIAKTYVCSIEIPKKQKEGYVVELTIDGIVEKKELVKKVKKEINNNE